MVLNKLNKERDDLIEDNSKHLKKMYDWINSKSEKELLYYIDNVKEETNKLRILFAFFPRNLKKLIKEIDYSTFEKLIKENCPEKYKLLVKNKRITKLKGMLLELKTHF